MKRNELIKLRELVQEEMDRRKRISELQENELIKEYLRLNNLEPNPLDKDNLREILTRILSSFSITETNGIYVCTSAYYFDCDICYEETTYYSRGVPINSNRAEFRIYTDIENGKSYSALKKEEDKRIYNYPYFHEFEANNIILNPYNTNDERNGYALVQYDYFATSLKQGQAKAKKLVLSKYPRL